MDGGDLLVRERANAGRRDPVSRCDCVEYRSVRHRRDHPSSDDDDIDNDYFEFGVQVSLAMKLDDPACIEAYGAMLENAVRI